MAKYRFSTRQAAEDSQAHYQRLDSLQCCAINCYLNGERSTWKRDGAYAVCVIGGARSDGGYVMLRFFHPGQKPSVATYYLDEWCHDMDHRPFPIFHDAEYASLRNLSFWARQTRDAALKADATPCEAVEA